MRIAVLSDIHSNIEALTKAFGVIDQSNVDEIYCLGDIVGYGASPNECVDLIRKRTVRTVIGNHDMGIIDEKATFSLPKEGKTVIEWTKKTLTRENEQYLRNLPAISSNDVCTLVHAGPHDPLNWDYIFSLQSAARHFQHFSTPFCFIGHTHFPSICGEDLKTFHFKRGIRFIINVGSVGQPRDGNPQLSFGILDTGEWSYNNIRASYDINSTARKILQNGLPRMFARRLSLGM